MADSTGGHLATIGDAELISALIAESFMDLPTSKWLIPERPARQQAFPAYFRILVDHALEHGAIYVNDDRTAVAAWVFRSHAPPSPRDYLPRLAVACPGFLKQFLAFDEILDANHPAQPHHHLALLAVHPSRQCQGLGSALLREHHGHLDRQGQAAYLEAAEPRSRDLYLRHGYEPLGQPFRLTNGPFMWPMWRRPRPG
jgi:GNAT superfamily N-acetyltransferase